MPLPVVAIIAEGRPLPVEARPAIVASCAKALGEALCIGESDALGPAARYLAVVSVGLDGKLRVNLRSRRDNVPRGERDLVFASAELGPEHWNSAGLVVAALVADAEQTAAAWAPPPEPPRTREADVNPPGPVGLWARVSVTVVVSPGFDFDPWRLGPTLRFAAGSPHGLFYPVLTTRWLTASGLVRSDVVNGALGVGARVINLAERLELDVEFSGVADALMVSAVSQGTTEQSFRVRYGARLGVSSSVRFAGSVHGFGGVDATWLGNRAILELDGQRLGVEPRYSPGFEVGLRLTF